MSTNRRQIGNEVSVWAAESDAIQLEVSSIDGVTTLTTKQALNLATALVDLAQRHEDAEAHVSVFDAIRYNLGIIDAALIDRSAHKGVTGAAAHAAHVVVDAIDND
jgi:hypothetical protein